MKRLIDVEKELNPDFDDEHESLYEVNVPVIEHLRDMMIMGFKEISKSKYLLDLEKEFLTHHLTEMYRKDFLCLVKYSWPEHMTKKMDHLLKKTGLRQNEEETKNNTDDEMLDSVFNPEEGTKWH